eukprot:RCo033400
MTGPVLMEEVQCTIVEGALDWLMQCLLATVAFLMLCVKWQLEVPSPRPPRIFLLDSAKQGCGFAVAHIGNLAVAQFLATPEQSACVWYLVNILLDTTVRVVLAFALLRAVYALLQWAGLDPQGRLKSGQYGDPINYTRWFKQLMLWVGVVLVSRIIMAGVVVAMAPWLASIGQALLAPLEDYSATHGHGLELLLVMVVLPTILNSAQLCVQDGFLKARRSAEDSLQLPNCCDCLRLLWWGRYRAVPEPRSAEGSTTLVTLLVDPSAPRTSPGPTPCAPSTPPAVAAASLL